MGSKDTLINVGLLAAGGMAIAAAAGVYDKGSRAKASMTLADVRAGDRVTYRDRFGKERTGHAVMPSAHGGWVLNMGGPYGTPGLVDERNFVRASSRRGSMAGRYPEDEACGFKIGDMVSYGDKVWQVQDRHGFPPKSYDLRLTVVVDPNRRHLDESIHKRNVPASDVSPVHGGANQISTLAYFNPEVVTDEDLAEGSMAKQSSVISALTSKKAGTPIPGPSLKTLADQLGIRDEEGKSLKHFMQTGARKAALDYANELLGGYGIDYIPSSEDGPTSFTGLDYVNMGDTYDTTLIFDRKKHRFLVSSWGDVVEREPRRFAD